MKYLIIGAGGIGGSIDVPTYEKIAIEFGFSE